MLGAILAPNGNGQTQITTTYTKSCEYIGRIKHSKLKNTAKCTAITTILEPGVLYPMMACLYDPQEIQKIEKIIARAKCPALGLNEHFPPAIHYGPYALGGLGIPSTPTKTTITRINYFLYNSRIPIKIIPKLEASIIFLQLELGIFHQFFFQPYNTYGMLGSKSRVKQIGLKLNLLA
jgi:hypothetical protein